MRRRVFSLLLALALTFSLLPASAEELLPPEGAEEVRAPTLRDLLLDFDPPAAFQPETLALQSQGAVALDFDTGEIYYQKAADVPRPAASMTKVMSLYLFFEAMDQGRFSPETSIPISAYAAEVSNHWAYSGKERFFTGEEVPASTLIALILTASANASVIALAEYTDGSEAAFTRRMNDRAAAWGLDARFADCTGYESEGNAVTPLAMAQIARRLIRDYPAVLDYAVLPEAVHRGRHFASTNRLLLEDAVAGIDGLKTGWTTDAGHCFTGTACRDGRRIITVVMDAGGGIPRMKESAMLLEYGFACRAVRESQWAEAKAALQADFTRAAPGFSAGAGFNRCTLTLRSCPLETPCVISLDVDGTPCFRGPATLGGDCRLSFLYTTKSPRPARVDLSVAFPDGDVLRWRGQAALQPLTGTGRLLLERSSVALSAPAVRRGCPAQD